MKKALTSVLLIAMLTAACVTYRSPCTQFPSPCNDSPNHNTTAD